MIGTPGSAGPGNPAPLVSVVIPAYNAAAFLRQTLDSVLTQTYHYLEVIVVDDGSTDDTARILDEYRGRLRVLQQRNAGQAAARNHGAQRAGGDLLAFLDSDDLWDREKIARQVEMLIRFPGAAATYCDHRTIDANGHLLGRSGALGYTRASGDITSALILGFRIVTPGLDRRLAGPGGGARSASARPARGERADNAPPAPPHTKQRGRTGGRRDER